MWCRLSIVYLCFVAHILLLRTQTRAFSPVERPRHCHSSSGGVTARTSGRSKSSIVCAAAISFAKYHGLGNDFILIDSRNRMEPSLTPEQAIQLCHRNFGVGADGVIFVLQPDADLAKAGVDCTMRIFNNDGTEPEMCGNGIRCLAKFLQDLSPISTSAPVTRSFQVHTLAGRMVPVMNDDGTVTVDMGMPIVAASQVPTTLKPNFEQDSVVEQTLECNGKTWKVSAVSMGNPHAIIFVDNLDHDLLDFSTDGPALEKHKAFPAKTNVEFVQVLAPNHLKMRVWERGAGPTMACGTGACALTVAAIRAGKIPRQASTPVRVTLPGGDLFIDWNADNNHVYMTGPATFVFSGQAELDDS